MAASLFYITWLAKQIDWTVFSEYLYLTGINLGQNIFWGKDHVVVTALEVGGVTIFTMRENEIKIVHITKTPVSICRTALGPSGNNYYANWQVSEASETLSNVKWKFGCIYT